MVSNPAKQLTIDGILQNEIRASRNRVRIFVRVLQKERLRPFRNDLVPFQLPAVDRGGLGLECDQDVSRVVVASNPSLEKNWSGFQNYAPKR